MHTATSSRLCASIIALLLLFLSACGSTTTTPNAQATACEVPAVVGLEGANAERLIQGVGLTVLRSAEFNPNVPAERIISQEPPAGTRLSPCAGEVRLVVSLGQEDGDLAPIQETAGSLAQSASTTELPVVVAGWWNTCVINRAGELSCWGNISTLPHYLGPMTQVSVGFEHLCAINSVGRLGCWDRNPNSAGTRSAQATVPSDLGPVTQVSTGGYHTCAITSAGVLHCWGSNTDERSNPTGQTTVPSDLGPVSHVSAGGLHTCAITSAGALRCWGSNADEHSNPTGQAIVPSDLGSVTQVNAGLFHTCVITSTGSLRCWGHNEMGQATVPNDLGPVSQISTGGFHTCAMTSTGALHCWGNNHVGQVEGLSNVGPCEIPALVGLNVGEVNIERTLQDFSGLRPQLEAELHQNLPLGQIISQEPPAGTQLDLCLGKIRIVVNDQPLLNTFDVITSGPRTDVYGKWIVSLGSQGPQPRSPQAPEFDVMFTPDGRVEIFDLEVHGGHGDAANGSQRYPHLKGTYILEDERRLRIYAGDSIFNDPILEVEIFVSGDKMIWIIQDMELEFTRIGASQ
ncbi:PASTA domain-containing protein [Candidatus Viridilinea mediisalina]|uniref:non-specific serine/threonine protein kinase n=1 Tax=Candidatus Viridilinea mediisalina TaxID=2024553 RepID=A0A2A6RDP3_9CHLR|nr:PASTA domain-containing protein [Candidatus Viridilinea mediisalina]PDW00136.1 hypothetical protein CJ255_21110 [Candidatus Viridilinea mediisalina]